MKSQRLQIADNDETCFVCGRDVHREPFSLTEWGRDGDMTGGETVLIWCSAECLGESFPALKIADPEVKRG